MCEQHLLDTMRLLRRLLVALCVPLSLQAQSASTITNVNIVDVRAATVLPRMMVVVRQGHIASISPFDSTAVPADTRRIDGHGAFLLPGLADLHAHLKRPDDLDAYVGYGVTLVQFLNAGTDVLQWRDSVQQGRRLGPEIHACAGAISDVATPNAAVERVRVTHSEGFRCIKPYDRYTDASFAALMSESRRLGLRSVSHIPRNLTWQQALSARPDAIAHLEEFLYSPLDSDAAVDSLITGLRVNNIAVVTTLTNYDLIGRQVFELPELLAQAPNAIYSAVDRRVWSRPLNRYASRFSVSQGLSLRRLLSFQRDLVRRLDSAGVRVLSGTDATNNFVIPGASTHDELDQLVHAGLSPARALRTATRSAAEFLGRGDSLGTVEVGKRADLLLVYGNPLRDIANTRLIAGVMRAGVWHGRDDLRALLARLRHRFAAESAFVQRAITAGPTRALARARAERYTPDPYVLNELGYQRWYMEDDTTGAGQAFRANLALHPTHPWVLASLGTWLAAVGDSTAARTLLAKAVRLHPKDQELAALAGQLKRARP